MICTTVTDLGNGDMDTSFRPDAATHGAKLTLAAVGYGRYAGSGTASFLSLT